MKDINEISHDVPIQMISQKDMLCSSLNAKEMLTIDFMIKEEDTDE